MSPRRRGLTTAAVAIAAVAVVVWLGVLDPVHAALLAVVAIAVTHVWRTLDEGQDVTWEPVPQDRRDGARNDVSELGWATFTRSGAVGDRMRRRIRAVAAARLAEHGIDLDDPAHHDAAARLLGTDVVEGLVSRRLAYRAEVHRWLDAIDAIDALAPSAPTHHPAAPTHHPAAPTHHPAARTPDHERHHA